ncbi:TerC family protein [Paenibacillaceae bacterium]|nr:TerC family protein [Paenibacillaceae bacterium]
MDLFSVEWFSALLSILIIDLVLAGDNAIVIGLAARRVPAQYHKLVIGFGTLGAIVIRIVATLAVAWLLAVPGLHLVGGILLIWIAYKLLQGEKEHNIAAKNSVMAAIMTIIVADTAMSLDNVLAVAGAAHGDFTLVVIGLVVSIPIVVLGSTVILKLTKRFPAIITIGAAVLAYTSANMITNEPFMEKLFSNGLMHWAFIIIVVVAVIWFGKFRHKASEKSHEHIESAS